MPFIFPSNKKSLKVLGIMNGTSLDGIDFVLVQISKKNLKCKFLKMKSFSFNKNLKKELTSAAAHELKVDQLALLHHELGRYYADCYKKLGFGSVDLIGLHGQTVFHKGGVASLQIGEPSYLSLAAACPVISDFRVSDIAVHGQGAPIATFFHQIVFGKINKKLSVHNLGGISNLTLIKNGHVVQGFDTGPANMLMDLEIQRSSQGRLAFDKSGAKAKVGRAHSELVGKMLTHPYFKMKAPKSCGREEFGISFLKKFSLVYEKLSLNDRLATLTEFVTQSIAQSYMKHALFMPSEIIFCGGGVENKYLINCIQKSLPKVKISSVSDYGWPPKSIEGAAFAILAAARAWNMNSNLPQSTGANKKVSLGKITVI